MGILLAIIMFFCGAPYAVAADAAVWNNRGVDLYSSGRFREAIKAYDQAIRLRPGYTDAYSNRGVAYDALNQPDRAVIDYSHAIQFNPRATQSYVNRALALCDLAKFQEAITDFNTVLKRNPRDSFAAYKRGFCYQSLGNLQLALADYDKALKINPRMSKASKSRDVVRKALALDSTLSTVAAVPTTTKPLSVIPDSVPQQSKPVPVVVKRPKVVEQQKTVQEPVAKIMPVPGSEAATGPAAYCVNVFHHVVGNVYSICGQYDAAALNYSSALTLNPKDQFAYYRRANVYKLSGQTTRAISDYESALRINPRFKQARAKRDRLISHDPSSASSNLMHREDSH